MAYAVKPMPRPRSLTPEALAAAALAVLDRDGIGGLSMRAVAARLGMGTMSLYRYVADRDALEELVVEHLLAPVDVSVPVSAPWQRQVSLLVERARAAVLEHPEVVPLLLRGRHRSTASLRWIEAMLGALTRGGFTGHRRVLAQRTLVSYLLGALQIEHYGALGGAGTSAMATLSEQEYPLLADTARQAQRIPPDEEFRRGLDAVLHGLSSWI